METTAAEPFWGKATSPTAICNSEFQSMLNDLILNDYTEYRLRYFLTRPFLDSGDLTADIESITRRVQAACDMVYETHAYEYQKLYESTQLEYDPIENFHSTEHEEITNDGVDTTTDTADSYTDRESRGSTSITDSWGSQTTNGSSTNQRAPFESQSYQNYDKDSTGATRESYTDTHTGAAVENSFTGGNRKNISKLDYGHEITRDLTRFGNIGVTTSQQMIQSERDLVRFNLARIVASDIIQSICISYMGVNL